MSHLQELHQRFVNNQTAQNANKKRRSNSRTDRQIQSFVRWVNDIISARGLEIEHFPQELKSGVIMCHLAELLTNSKLKRFNAHPKSTAHEIDNLSNAFQLLKRTSLRLVNVGPMDVHRGNVKCILGMLWSCVQTYQLNIDWNTESEQNPKSKTTKNGDTDNALMRKVSSPEQSLMKWTQNQLKSENVCAPLTFDDGWQNGKILAHLIHSICPNGIDLSSINAQSEYIDAALWASLQLGVAPILTADDIKNGADSKTMITWLSCIKQAAQNNFPRAMQKKAKFKFLMNWLNSALKNNEQINDFSQLLNVSMASFKPLLAKALHVDMNVFYGQNIKELIAESVNMHGLVIKDCTIDDIQNGNLFALSHFVDRLMRNEYKHLEVMMDSDDILKKINSHIDETVIDLENEWNSGQIFVKFASKLCPNYNKQNDVNSALKLLESELHIPHFLEIDILSHLPPLLKNLYLSLIMQSMDEHIVSSNTENIEWLKNWVKWTKNEKYFNKLNENGNESYLIQCFENETKCDLNDLLIWINDFILCHSNESGQCLQTMNDLMNAWNDGSLLQSLSSCINPILLGNEEQIVSISSYYKGLLWSLDVPDIIIYADCDNLNNNPQNVIFGFLCSIKRQIEKTQFMSNHFVLWLNNVIFNELDVEFTYDLEAMSEINCFRHLIAECLRIELKTNNFAQILKDIICQKQLIFNYRMDEMTKILNGNVLQRKDFLFELFLKYYGIANKQEFESKYHDFAGNLTQRQILEKLRIFEQTDLDSSGFKVFVTWKMASVENGDGLFKIGQFVNYLDDETKEYIPAIIVAYNGRSKLYDIKALATKNENIGGKIIRFAEESKFLLNSFDNDNAFVEFGKKYNLKCTILDVDNDGFLHILINECAASKKAKMSNQQMTVCYDDISRINKAFYCNDDVTKRKFANFLRNLLNDNAQKSDFKLNEAEIEKYEKNNFISPTLKSEVFSEVLSEFRQKQKSKINSKYVDNLENIMANIRQLMNKEKRVEVSFTVSTGKSKGGDLQQIKIWITGPIKKTKKKNERLNVPCYRLKKQNIMDLNDGRYKVLLYLNQDGIGLYNIRVIMFGKESPLSPFQFMMSANGGQWLQSDKGGKIHSVKSDTMSARSTDKVSAKQRKKKFIRAQKFSKQKNKQILNNLMKLSQSSKETLSEIEEIMQKYEEFEKKKKSLSEIQKTKKMKQIEHTLECEQNKVILATFKKTMNFPGHILTKYPNSRFAKPHTRRVKIAQNVFMWTETKNCKIDKIGWVKAGVSNSKPWKFKDCDIENCRCFEMNADGKILCFHAANKSERDFLVKGFEIMMRQM